MFKSLVNDIAKVPSTSNFFQLTEYVENEEVSNDEIAYLARILANSGETLEFSSLTADIPSTGGPSSLSTIICPLILSMFYKVPKLGVSGRPAGGLDILAQLSDYRVQFNKREIEDILHKNDYVHFIANESFAPLDKALFSFRKENDKVNIPELVIASLLSKKMACGLKFVGLDVRISEFGNFGKTVNQAEKNARRFKEVGEILGIKIKAFLSDSNYVYQPYIGRGESLVALGKIISGELDHEPLLRQHLNYCLLMVKSIIPNENLPFDITSVLRDNFFNNLKLQGSSKERFEEKINEIVSRKTVQIRSQNAGFVNYNLESIRSVLTSSQLEHQTDELFPDPIGVILKKDHGDFVNSGEILAELRYDSNTNDIEKIESQLADSITAEVKLDKGRYFQIMNYGW